MDGRNEFFLPGNPPFIFLSHRIDSCVVLGEVVLGERWIMDIVYVPPVVGIRATSPRDVEKVERSSWAIW